MISISGICGICAGRRSCVRIPSKPSDGPVVGSAGSDSLEGAPEQSRYGSVLKALVVLAIICGCLLIPFEVAGQSTNNVSGAVDGRTPFKLDAAMQSIKEPGNVDTAVQILFAITLLSLAPSIILLMTCFTRIVVVLSFVRSALSLQQTPANQIIIGLSLFISFFIMAPVWERINADALVPYREEQISGEQALNNAGAHVRRFMLRQTRPGDVELFVGMAKMGPTAPEELPLRVVIPGFIVSELRTAFQMGFLLYVPFILIDLVVATVLMSMGMMMMPPMMISLPLKILLFVLVDGWSLVVRSVVMSFGT
ncbi:MAG: flagellar type III secretion system pore protein FliP [Verrucomicrobia bacterium]|nr:flagellar type III secretion system pore protein FliP [Verrucomicrobiota bacterium]